MTGTIFHLCLAMGLFVAIYLAMSDRPLRTTAIDRISDPRVHRYLLSDIASHAGSGHSGIPSGARSLDVHHKDGPKIQIAFVNDIGHVINQRSLRKTGDAMQETIDQLFNMLQIDPNSIEAIPLNIKLMQFD